MSGESTELSVTVSADLDEWLGERAEESGLDREELLVQLLGAYRATADGDAAETAIERLASDEDVPDAVDERLDAFEDNLAERLTEFRRRLTQLKEGLDRKAPADHDHEEFRRLADLADHVEELTGAVGSIRDDVEHAASEAEVDELEERLDDVEAKLTRVARLVVSLRKDRDAAAARDDDVRELKRTAATEGIRSAKCGACRQSVDVSLLVEPACPHCETAIDHLEPSTGLIFGSPRLAVVGDGTEQKALPEGETTAHES